MSTKYPAEVLSGRTGGVSAGLHRNSFSVQSTMVSLRGQIPRQGASDDQSSTDPPRTRRPIHPHRLRSLRQHHLIMGGRPSKGTSADRRLGTNKPSPAPKPKSGK